MRPHQFYKHIFHQRISDLAPKSILDVGCGSGNWVTELRENGIEAHGIETSSSITLSNPYVQKGSAEELPYPDKSVDYVTSEFSAHHFSDLTAHLREACRVARKGIAILDPWYDDNFASQRTARAFDVWLKTIDRSTGQVHHDVITSTAFLDAMPSDQTFDVSFQNLLKMEVLPEEKLTKLMEEYSSICSHYPDRMQELANLKSAIDIDGISQDGAIIFIAELN